MANTYNICNKLQAIADAITQGGGGGGGTTVIANPTGTPTADLNTVQIGQTIYDIPGGGGGGGSAYREDIIFTGSNSDTSPITLSTDINYYDLLQFIVAYVDHKVTETFEIPVNYFVNNYTYSTFSDIHNTDNISLTLAGNEWFRIARGQTDTQLQFMKGSNFYLKSVIGIKLPRGAGSDEAADINYDNTTSGLTATNVQDAIDENTDSIDTLNSNISYKTGFIDTSNLITTINTYNADYTATADCWCIGFCRKSSSGSNNAQVNLDSANVANVTSTDNVIMQFPVKAGQHIKTRNDSGGIYTLFVYGML
jgi:hypothetical protein